MLVAVLKFFLDFARFLWIIVVGYASSLTRLAFPPPPKSLKNEVILVTGGASGIGQAILLHLAKLEPEMILISWDTDHNGNESTINTLRALGVKRALAYTVDVSNRNQVTAAATKIRQEVGDVTMLFNNAGISGALGKCWETDLDLTEKTLWVNVLSHCFILREFLPAMIKANRGHVIATCSLFGFLRLRDSGAYIASKLASHGYYECLKEDLRGIGSEVVVSIVYPGHIATKMVASLDFSLKAFEFLSKATTPPAAAKLIINKVVRNEDYIYVPSIVRLLITMFPSFPSEVYRRVVDMLDVNVLRGKLTFGCIQDST